MKKLLILLLLSGCSILKPCEDTEYQLGACIRDNEKCKAFLEQCEAQLPSPPTFIEANINYFNWNCESTDSASAPFVPPASNNSTLSTEQKHTGTKSCKYSVIGNDSGNQQAGWEFVSPDVGPLNDGKSLYYRWWMLIDSNFKWGLGTAKTKTSRMKDAAQQTSPAWTGYISKSKIYIGECRACSPIGQGSSDGDPSNAQIPHNFQNEAGKGWVEWIVRMRLQSSTSNCDGEFEVYRNTTSIGKVEGMCFINSVYADKVGNEAWSGWMIRPYFQLNGTSTDGGKIYVDDFSMDSSWNSSIGTPPPDPEPIPEPPVCPVCPACPDCSAIQAAFDKCITCLRDATHSYKWCVKFKRCP